MIVSSRVQFWSVAISGRYVADSFLTPDLVDEDEEEGEGEGNDI